MISDMKIHGVLTAVLAALCIDAAASQCRGGQSLTYTRWMGVAPDRYAPVFVYTASGDEASLTGACLARCRELQDCAGVAVAYGRGSCQGLAAAKALDMKIDSDASYFEKVCLELPDSCASRWWALESTPGYHLNTEGANLKVVLNTTVQECYSSLLTDDGQRVYRSAQWVGPDNTFDSELIQTSVTAIGNCIVNVEDKFTEPESYRVANYHTFYIENQCRSDYSKKIDRCSYEEYYNQTLKHIEFSATNYTKDECKKLCEQEEHFVCRGFTWSPSDSRGLCDLHSEDLVSTGSWLLRRATSASYYRRVICLNISVECEDQSMIITYRARGVFRGRVYVPGRGEQCGARAAGAGGLVRLRLPLYGDCDVNFAHAISRGPSGTVNRTMAYVMVMIQNNAIIQTAGDRWVRVGCAPAAGRQPAAVDATIAVRDTSKPSFETEPTVSSPASASAVFNTIPDSSLTMYVVRADDTQETPSGGAVALGEPLELRIETTDESEIEAYHLVASSRLGDSSVLLLDSRGCPTGQVDFPPFARSLAAGAQRLSARFKAFRFPTSHVVRFALMVRRCEGKCLQPNCDSRATGRAARNTNDTYEPISASVREDPRGVVATGGCGAGGRAPLEVELVVGARDILSADTLLRADSQVNQGSEDRSLDASLVCVHELVLVALALAWLAVQVLLLLGCCVLVKRYRNLAEMSMQKDYQSFDNVGFDTSSTARRVHWPDQGVDILHDH